MKYSDGPRQLYMNRDTGEVLTRKQMLAQWAEEYDGGDPTNPLSYEEKYEPIGDEI